jgi:uncharacterized protein (TIGR03437 family)
MDSSRMRHILFLLVVLALCAPLAAQPTPSATAVNFQYTPGGANNNSATISFSNGTITGARISVNIDQNGNQVPASSASATGVFVSNSDASAIHVALDSNTLAALAQKGQNTYQGTLLWSYADHQDYGSIALNLTIGSNGQVTVSWNGAAVPSGGVSISAAIGAQAVTSLVLSSPSVSQQNWSIVTSGLPAWLTVSPVNGIFGGGATATITLTATASNASIGNNTYNLTINTSLGNPVVPVNFLVANSNTLTLSPSTLNFSYAISTQSYPTGQSQQVTASGATAGTVVSATVSSYGSCSGAWLSIGALGQTSYSGLIGSTSASPFIYVNATALGNPPPTTTCTGSIQFTAGTLSATLFVTLTISGTPSSSGSLTFTVPYVGGTAASQNITITGNGNFLVTPTNYVPQNATGWLTLNTYSGSVVGSQLLTVYVNPGTLPAGSYQAQIVVYVNSQVSQTITVTMNIGGSSSTGPLVSPTSLTFGLPANSTQTQQVIVTGSGSYTAQAFGNGITVSPTSGNTPAVVSVSVNSGASGVTTGANSGYVSFLTSNGSQSITVVFNVLAGAVIQANPASYATLSTTGLLPNMSIFSNVDSGGQGLAFTVTPPSFVSVSANSGTTPYTLGVSINSGSLQPGLNSGNIVITAPSAGNTPINVPVTVLAPGGTQGLSLSPNPLNITGYSGGAVVASSVTVSGISGLSFTAAASSTGNWLSVSPTSGSVPSAGTTSLNISANPQYLAAGTTYNGTVTLTASNGSTALLNVSFAVGSPQTSSSTLSVSNNNLTFSYQQGGAAPQAQTVNITAVPASVNFTVTASASWISATASTNATPATLTVTVDPSKANTGTNTGTVTVTSPGAQGSPQTIQVTLNVSALPTLTVPAGNQVTFSYTTNGALPGPQTLHVGSSTGASIPFTVSVTSAPWLTVTPTSGNAPADLTLTVDPSKVSAGTVSATLTLNASGSSQNVTVSFTVSAPLPSIATVVNAASNQPGPIAPGEIIVLTGAAMGPDPLVTLHVTGNVVDSTLSSTVVKVGGFNAPMIYTSSTQVAAVVPYEIAGRASTFVQVQYLGQSSNTVSVQVAATSPAIFSLDSTGKGPGAILNQDGSVNSPNNPASPNTVIQVFMTGEGQTIPSGVDGQLTPNDINALPRPVQPVTATVDNEPCTVFYAGGAPGIVAGLMQVNILLPPDAKSGDVVISVGGNPTPSGVTVAVR